MVGSSLVLSVKQCNTIEEVEKLEKQFWNIPNVEGKAQVPYLFGEEGYAFLNACIKKREEIEQRS